MIYVVLDDQSTDVFVTDLLPHKLNVSGQEVNLQVSPILGINTILTRRVSSLQIQHIDGKTHQSRFLMPMHKMHGITTSALPT